MVELSKEFIISELKRLAEANGGKAPGLQVFRKETGISQHQINSYWVNYSDLVKESGYEPNEFTKAYSDEHIIIKFIELINEFNKYPTESILRFKAKNDTNFPSMSTMQKKFGSKFNTAKKTLESGLADNNSLVLDVCQEIIDNPKSKSQEKEGLDSELTEGKSRKPGLVYLFKHGDRNEYKIGKSLDTVRRGQELRTIMPQDLELIHEIKTDDPFGIEKYWHKRFEKKRLNGAWFNQSSEDIKAFKRWKRIY
ncbi:MAG: GIY-YIG nuclease family protein [Candidatus Caenarcaniphilales bacterium]|nr:GIY-YIG nuclease family protein [Candidatus Caenarcaniphilales bacterium]